MKKSPEYDYIGRVQPCRKCGQPIVIGRTRKNRKWVPLNPESLTLHFLTCRNKRAAERARLLGNCARDEERSLNRWENY